QRGGQLIAADADGVEPCLFGRLAFLRSGASFLNRFSSNGTAAEKKTNCDDRVYFRATRGLASKDSAARPVRACTRCATWVNGVSQLRVSDCTGQGRQRASDVSML